MGLDGSEPRIARAADFIAGNQRDKGSWEEHESLKPLAPPWAAPGDPAARLYLTANCGFWLSVLGQPGAGNEWEEAAKRAAGFLEEQLGEQGSLPSFLHANWLAAGLWSRTGHSAPTKKVCGYLENRLHDLSPSNLAWILLTLANAGMPDRHPLIQGAIRRLVQSQSPDGRWPSDDGLDRDVHATLEALRAIRLWR